MTTMTTTTAANNPLRAPNPTLTVKQLGRTNRTPQSPFHSKSLGQMLHIR